MRWSRLSRPAPSAACTRRALKNPQPRASPSLPPWQAPVNAFLRHLRRGAFAIGSGVFLGLIAAFGLVAPVFVQHPVVYAAPADALPPCPAYQAMLDQYLTVLRAKDGDVQRPVMTTFDYARLALYPDGKTKL